MNRSPDITDGKTRRSDLSVVSASEGLETRSCADGGASIHGAQAAPHAPRKQDLSCNLVGQAVPPVPPNLGAAALAGDDGVHGRHLGFLLLLGCLFYRLLGRRLDCFCCRGFL